MKKERKGPIMNNRRWLVSVVWIVLGAVLTVCGAAGVVDEYWSGMGGGLIAVGVLQLFRYIRYATNKTYRETVEVERNDERNRYIGMKAWAWAGYSFVLIAAVASIALKIAGQDVLSRVAGLAVCLLVVLYWLNWLWLRKKY